MTDPNNPYLKNPAGTAANLLGQIPQKPAVAPPAGMDPAKFQRQQQRTAVQNDRTAAQQAQALPQVTQPYLPPQNIADNMMHGFEALGQQSGQATGVAGPAQPALPTQAIAPSPTPQPPQGQIGGAPSAVSPGRPMGQPQGFNPRQMLKSYAGAQRGQAMEKMARPTGMRSAFKQAQTTGAVPGFKPPKPL